jgi:hypothetical protein
MSDLDNEEIEATKKLQEKSADEMFEELGYRKINYPDANYSFLAEYVKATIDITFYKDKTFRASDLGGIYWINMQELQAINKKCKELRMDLKKQ